MSKTKAPDSSGTIPGQFAMLLLMKYMIVFTRLPSPQVKISFVY